jgi:hypothetical protein
MPHLRRLIYTSHRVDPDGDRDLLSILASARRNNGIDGVTGLLWADKDSYLQVLEGPPESVDLAFKRISSDPRHTGIIVLDERLTTDRVFADWAMAAFPGEAPEDAQARLRRMLERVPDEMARHFAGRC